jgi:hypothetical protein
MHLTWQLCHTPAYPWENPTETLPLILKTLAKGVYMWVLGGRGRVLAFDTLGLPLLYPRCRGIDEEDAYRLVPIRQPYGPQPN